tara:strand:+ start:27398 stop:28741 length:1344 start_codon:yes stop_codon:yes gene_type:complete
LTDRAPFSTGCSTPGPTLADGDGFTADTVWNLLSLTAQVAAGACLTIGVYFMFGSAPLGVFNQLYAIFAISGQLFVFGLNDSALKHSAQHLENRRQSDLMLETGLRLAACGGAVGMAAILAFAAIGGEALFGENVRQGLFFVGPAILLFVVNKALFGFLNGRRWFGRFALVQAVRAMVLTACVFAVLGAGAGPQYLGLCFGVTEAIVLLINWDLIRDAIRLGAERRLGADGFREWTRTHLSFGMRSMPHGFLSETFIRVDIVILMMFVDDATVGVYSFAAFFIEGIYQLPVVIRNITNPRLVPVFATRAGDAFRRLLIRSGGVSVLLTGAATLALLVLAPLIESFVAVPEFDTVYGVLLVVLPALVFYAFSVPFDYAILQAGRPGLQSLFMILATGLNVIGNLVLIPDYGLSGAAMATAIAMVGTSLCLWGILLGTFRIPSWPRTGD